MKQIKLPHGRLGLVDDEDFEIVNKWRWCVNSSNYVLRVEINNKKRKTITMHRFLMNPPRTLQIDHINGNRLDNQRSNLRICTGSQNCAAKNKTTAISGFRGVTFHPPTKKWRSTIKVNQTKIALGLYKNKLDAARAYNIAAQLYFGQFARLNLIPQL